MSVEGLLVFLSDLDLVCIGPRGHVSLLVTAIQTYYQGTYCWHPKRVIACQGVTYSEILVIKISFSFSSSSSKLTWLHFLYNILNMIRGKIWHNTFPWGIYLILLNEKVCVRVSHISNVSHIIKGHTVFNQKGLYGSLPKLTWLHLERNFLL